MKKILKSKINRRIIISASKIVAVFLGIFAFAGLTGTFAYFSSSSSVQNNTFSAGCWVKPATPQLAYPTNNYIAGSSSAWVANPYMDWTDSTANCPLSTNIQYQYESYHDAGLTNLAYRSGLLSGSMIPAPGTPDGNYYWRARAFDGYTWSDWSEVWLLRVDTRCPYAQITNPGDTSTINGTVAVRGTVTDSNPHHYWLVVENSSGVQVAGPGVINDTNSFTNQLFFNWDTTAVPDGTYTIKIEARDAFDNKCPNLAPVPSDPENPFDSVDWITVTVDNASAQSVNIIAKKVICNNESDLPNWGNHGAVINANTAQNYVNSNQNCHIENGWQFQWGAAGAGSFGAFQTQTDEITNGSWHTFGSSVTINNISSLGGRIEAREVFPNSGGYFGFSNNDNVSAEFYCTGDVYNYDNWEWIQNLQAGDTYYCVAFNTSAGVSPAN